MDQKPDKQSPLTAQTKRQMRFDDDKANFRAVSEEVDGSTIRHLKGYALLFDVPGRPVRGSQWIEKIHKDAIKDVDFSKLVILIDHNTTWVLGKAGKNMTVTVDDTGLFVDVILRNTWIDDYIFDRVEGEIIDSMSFWFDRNSVIATDWDNKIDYIMKINEIYEVSILVFAAYEETVMVAVDQTEQTEAEQDGEALREALKTLIDTY